MKALIIILCIVGGLALIMGVGILFLNKGMGQIRKLVIKDVDLGTISDGVYTGQYHMGRWTYDVEVTVKDHRITEIRNTNKKMDEMSKAWNEAAAKAVIDKQSLKIDAVTGATINTNAFLTAVGNALEPGSKGP